MQPLCRGPAPAGVEDPDRHDAQQVARAAHVLQPRDGQDLPGTGGDMVAAPSPDPPPESVPPQRRGSGAEIAPLVDGAAELDEEPAARAAREVAEEEKFESGDDPFWRDRGSILDPFWWEYTPTIQYTPPPTTSWEAIYEREIIRARTSQARMEVHGRAPTCCTKTCVLLKSYGKQLCLLVCVGTALAAAAVGVDSMAACHAEFSESRVDLRGEWRVDLRGEWTCVPNSTLHSVTVDDEVSTTSMCQQCVDDSDGLLRSCLAASTCLVVQVLLLCVALCLCVAAPETSRGGDDEDDDLLFYLGAIAAMAIVACGALVGVVFLVMSWNRFRDVGDSCNGVDDCDDRFESALWYLTLIQVGVIITPCVLVGKYCEY
jgi:hypothetical protein